MRGGAQRQRRVFVGDNHHVHIGRAVLQEEGERLVYGQGLDQVVVIQNDDEGRCDKGEFVDQSRKQSFGRGRLGRVHHALSGPAMRELTACSAASK